MNKPVYRQSTLANYFECPFRFVLSQRHPLPSTTAMDDGRLFEALVLGAKDEAERDELFGRKRPKTIDSYCRAVDIIKPIFPDSEKSSYVEMRWDGPDWTLQGEADYIGDVVLYGKRCRAIADLKFTGSITKIWMEKTRKSEFLQSAVYQFLHYKKTGELLPFIYVTVENIKSLPDGASPLIKPYVIQPTVEGLDWVIETINHIHNDVFPNTNLNACEEGYYRNRCKYLIHCASGRKLIESPVEVDFMGLQD